MLPHPYGACDMTIEILSPPMSQALRCPKSVELHSCFIVLLLFPRRSGGCMSRVCCGRRSFAVAVYIRVRCVYVGVVLLVHAHACFVCFVLSFCVSVGPSLGLFGSCLSRLPLSSLSLCLSRSLCFSLFLSLFASAVDMIITSPRETHGLRP